MKSLKLTLASVIYSKAGRDAKNKFVVIDIIDNEYVLLVDGHLRKIEKPKKKKIKHIELTDFIIYDIKDKLDEKKKLTNAEIRKCLQKLTN
ncbi:MAG: RNA-binding protein [Clostridiales bacterium]